MLFPIRDVIPSPSKPIVTLGLIASNLAIYVWLVSTGEETQTNVMALGGLTPAAFTWASVVSSMFIHPNLIHLASNMVSLWIFGDNVEDQLGHARFLAFYLLCGVVGALAEVTASPDSAIPIVGASGAIAGVMGAYIAMFPKSRVLVLLFLVFYVNVFEVPALFFLAFWFLMQVVAGIGRTSVSSGVAFWAHIGGFVAGMLSARLLRRSDRTVWARRG